MAIEVNLSTGAMSVVDGHTVDPQPLPNPTWVAATDNGVVCVVETYGEQHVEGKQEPVRNDG